jgi:predicted nucleic acid-binding protein
VYLIDTSVWIDYFRDIKNASTTKFESILDRNLPFGLTGVIYQEILQGAVTDKDFDQLKDYLATQRFFHPQDEIVTYEFAAKLFYLCRRNGITIRSTIDCLVAQIAIEHNLVILHNDQNYNRIQSVVPELLLCD